jgi:deaminated glutathione amidase
VEAALLENRMFRAALVQLCSGREIAPNMAFAGGLIRAAAAGGANYIQTPENTALVELSGERLFERIRPEAETAILGEFAALAGALGVWLHIGSIAIRVGEHKAANRSYVFSPTGRIAARYDKIHMFDVDLPSGESYRESKNYRPGARAVKLGLPWGVLGMTTCYDLRFPEQYKALAQAGADFLAVPSAFTRQTGAAHWHVLLRARAIETGCFVLAAAQGGDHEVGRATYGHSMIVSPWGEIIAEGGEEPGIIAAEIDPREVAAARQRIPALNHVRPIEVADAYEHGPSDALDKELA